jgi:hypothetical protein
MLLTDSAWVFVALLATFAYLSFFIVPVEEDELQRNMPRYSDCSPLSSCSTHTHWQSTQ